MTNGTTIKNIFVSAGTYSQGSSYLDISSKANLSIYGGFNVGFTARDAVNRTNVIYKTEITSTGGYEVVRPWGCNNFLIDGFAITTASGTKGFYSSGSPAGTTISNCTVTITGSGNATHVTAIDIYDGTLNKIENCIVDLRGLIPSMDSIGINYSSNGDCTIKNNTVYPSRQTNSGRQLIGIGTFSRVATIITGNTVSFTQTANSSGSQIRGISYSSSMRTSGFDLIIANNTVNSTPTAFNGCNPYGIYVDDSDVKTFIVNNVVAYTGGSVQYPDCIYLAASGNNEGRVYNNTIYIASTPSSAIRAINAQDPGMIIKNNIIVATFSTGTFYGIAKGASTVCQNNLIYSPNRTDGYTYGASNIFGTDPVLDTANGYSLNAGSSTNARTGGLNLYTEQAIMQTDNAGTARLSGTGIWSIGAYYFAEAQ